MADENTETTPETAVAEKKSGKGRLLLILVVLLLVAGGTGAGLYFGGMLNSGKSAKPAPAADADPAADSEGVAADGETSGKPIFYAMDPAFVVNLEGDQDAPDSRYLQATVQVMTHDQAVIDAIEQYQPVIRNNLLLLFSSQSMADISTRDGKEKLRQATLDEIRKVLDEQHAPDSVEAVYFTSFVMQ